MLIIFSLGSRMINMLVGVVLCRQRTTRACAAESDAVLLIDHFVRHDTYGDLKFCPITVMLKFLSGLPPGM
jgi:hypothetical protein